MGQILYANARTTEAIRREIRNSKESIAKVAARFNVNPKTIIKWRKREDTKDLPMGPKKIKSTVLSEAEEMAIVAFRNLTNLPLDDVLYSLQDTYTELDSIKPTSMPEASWLFCIAKERNPYFY
jgi:hypothetical protein